jgi:hypothetical protein
VSTKIEKKLKQKRYMPKTGKQKTKNRHTKVEPNHKRTEKTIKTESHENIELA